MRAQVQWAVAIIGISWSSSAFGQFIKPDAGESPLAVGQVQKLQVGIIIQAAPNSYCRGIYAHTAVPMDWPEQQVRILEEDVSPTARLTYRVIDGMAKAMEVRAAALRGGEPLKAVVTFEVRRRVIPPPENVDQYVIPARKKLDRNVLVHFLAPSHLIESNHPRIEKLAKQIGADQPTAWKRVEAVYDWVRENVRYQNGPIKGALRALEDGTGDCEELTSLFIAICRAGGIPARTVWVEGHCYPEFLLQDTEGKSHWFACQAAGSRSFGGINELRPILQKGDNIRPPQTRRRQRYLADYVNIVDAPAHPKVQFLRKVISD